MAIPNPSLPCPGRLRGFVLSATLLALLGVAPSALRAQYTGGLSALQQQGPKHIYSETANPRAEIAAALKQAQREHKRVLLDFGGDWCGDCQVLNIYFHQQPNLKLLQDHFVLVDVWVGQLDHNLDIAKRYGVPVTKGVPALAVLSPTGKVLYAQRSGEFDKMSQMTPQSVTAFLEKWKR